MARCCCCIGLRTGCILIGLIFLVIDAAGLIWSALSLAGELARPFPDVILNNFSGDTLRITLWVALAVAAVSVLCDIALLAAAVTRRRCGQILWLVWNGILLTIVTILLLVVLGVAIWLLVDADAAEKLGLRQDAWEQVYETLTPLTEDERREQKMYGFLTLLIGAIVGIVIMSILWGWYSAVDRNQRRLRHTTVIVKTQHVHTSRL